MEGIEVTLLKNKQFVINNIDDYKVIEGENNATSILVHFPSEYQNYSKRVDFKNPRNEKWTISLYAPEDENNVYGNDFDKLNFSFTLPSAVTINGEMKVQFVAYLDDDAKTVVPFDMLKVCVKNSVYYVKKNASDNPDLIVDAYNNSNKALAIARDSFDRIENAEASAKKAEEMAIESQKNAQSAQASATSAQSSATSANTRAKNAEASAKSAQESAEYAEQVSNEANTKSDNAVSTANSANTKSDNAVTTSNTALTKAQEAVTTANSANTKSNNAVTTANTANTKSDTAISTANSAKTISEEALEQVVEKMGTKVFVGSAETPETNLNFESDPQTQINNIKTNKTTIANTNGGFSCGSGASNTKDLTFKGFTLCDSNGKIPVARLFDAIYPVGSIYMSTSSTNPGTLFGGTWEAYAQGRTIIGTGTSDQTFTAGATGGASNHTLTTAQMPSHTHTQNAHGHSGNSKSFYFWFAQFTHRDNQPETDFIGCFKNSDNSNVTLTQHDYYNNTDAIGSGSRWGYRKVGVNWEHTPSINNTTATNNNTGGGGAHNNLQPYIVTYIWRRTA